MDQYENVLKNKVYEVVRGHLPPTTIYITALHVCCDISRCYNNRTSPKFVILKRIKTLFNI